MDRLFDYQVPDEMTVNPGQAVEVPFNHRQVAGYVISINKKSLEQEEKDLKCVARVLSENESFSLSPELLALVNFLRERYFCSWGAAIQAVLPPVTRAQVTRVYTLLVPGEDLSEEVIQYFHRRKSVAKKVLQEKFGLSDTQLAKAVARGALGVEDVLSARLRKKPNQSSKTDRVSSKSETPESLHLSAEQDTALNQVLEALKSGESRTFLMHGVTGSGKTEVYLRAIEQVTDSGRQALMLVPEISLTTQMTARFRSRFGQRVAVLHSRLSNREKYEEWQRILRGEADIVIGARSAIFAPLSNVGIAILDEEHESSYKQEKEPHYVAREVAAWRTQRHQAVLVLGSATPSLESMYRAERGRYNLLTLSRRVEDRDMAKVKVVNMRDEFKNGHHSMFSRPLKTAIQGVLERKEQAILFLNRRGYSTFLQCRACGNVVTCKDCDITLTLHKKGSHSRLQCHFCGHSSPLSDHCPSCGSGEMRQFGTGTQRVEHDLLLEFPGIKVLRMDVDTTRQKGAHERILSEFGKGQADVLLGTQMIAKGLDFEKISLVGVIAADTSLFLPDFRASERTFQLLVQVAGRAGRHQVPGQMIIQTFAPEHYAITLAASQDYTSFYELELSSRKAMGYPPFTEIAQFVLTHVDDNVVRSETERLYQDLQGLLRGIEGVRLLHPAPANITRLRGRFRYQILVVYPSFKAVREALNEGYRRAIVSIKPDTSITIDINAYTLD